MSIVLTNKRTKIGTAFDVNTTVENQHIEITPSPRVTRILVPEKHRVMRKPC